MCVCVCVHFFLVSITSNTKINIYFQVYKLKGGLQYNTDCFSYALVICNHGPPTPGEGRGIAVEMSGVFTFALSPQCGGNTRDLCYIG